jgi:hypothetical protein
MSLFALDFVPFVWKVSGKGLFLGAFMKATPWNKYSNYLFPFLLNFRNALSLGEL